MKNIIRDRNREMEAQWYMYTRCGWSMQEIADIFKVSKPQIQQNLNKYAFEKKEELDKLPKSMVQKLLKKIV